MKTKFFFLIFILITTANIQAQVPNWSWAKSIESAADEMAPCSTLDLDGNLYVFGHHTALSITFDDTTIYNSLPNNVYFAKYNPSGELLFVKNLNVDINPARITVDKNNNIIAVAYFMETLTFGNITVHKTSEGGNNGSDLVILKFDANGNVIGASQGFGCDGFERFSGMAIDDSSNIYVGGAFDGAKIIFNNDTILNTGGNDAFLLKFNSSAEQIWARGVHGNLEELGGGICTDKDGFIYNTGTYTSQTINFDGINMLSNHGNNLQNKSIFFSKYTSSGTLIWSNRIGGYGNEDNPFIKTDSANNIYLAGTSESQPIFYDTTNIQNDQWNVFIVKLDNVGSLLWSKTSTGNGYKVIKDVVIDTIGNTYFCGYFFNQYTIGADSFINNDNPDIFLSKINSMGNASWSKTISGNMFEIPENISLHPNGSVYISGSFQSDTLYLDTQRLINKSTVSGYSDIFIAHTFNTVLSSNSPLCVGNNLQLSISTIPEASYSWSGPNNFSSTEQNPVIENATVDMSGTYIIHVVTPDLLNMIDSISINIFPIPETPTATNSSPTCMGGNVSLISSTIENASYHWTNSNGFSILGQNPTITPDSSGYYFLQTIVNGCQSLIDTTYVTINPIPDAPLIYGDSKVCLGTGIYLNSNTVEGASYTWNGPNGYTSTAQNPLVCSKASLINSGYYSASITLNGCVSPSDSFEVIVNPSMTAPNICIIVTDSITHKNKIIWDKEASTAILNYNIYKETDVIDQFLKIGTVLYDSSSIFIDTLSNPLRNSEKYRISLTDTCLIETMMSPLHKTIYLSMNQGMGDTYNLTWDGYVGNSISAYSIYRGSSPDSLTLLASLTSTDNSFTDFSPPSGYVYYQITGTTPNCVATNDDYTSKSNIASNDPNYLNTSTIEYSLFPIPSGDQLRVSSPFFTGTQHIEVLNFEGVQIFSVNFEMNESTIDISSLQSGMYFLKITQNNIVSMKSFIKL